jgi:predicted kinase
MTSKFLLQMAGESGTGKSTLARAIGRRTGAVVLDKDAISAPLMEEGLDAQTAGGYAYRVLFSVVRSVLETGHSVVIDSAAFYASILERGKDAAAEYDVDYFLIECHCTDALAHETRLDSRQRRITQPASLIEVIEQRSLANRVALNEPHLLLDTAQPLDVCVEKALEYLGR